MYSQSRSTSRREDMRTHARGGVPLGKTSLQAGTLNDAHVDPVLAMPTDANLGSATTRPANKLRKRVSTQDISGHRMAAPLASSTNNEYARNARAENFSNSGRYGTSNDGSQRRQGRASTPMVQDENEDWSLAQPQPPIPAPLDSGRSRTRTSSGGNRGRLKSEEKKQTALKQASALTELSLPSSQAGTVGQADLIEENSRASKRRSLAFFSQNPEEGVNDYDTALGPTEEKAKPLRRKLSWGKNKHRDGGAASEESKRASRIGMTLIENDLLPSLRDTIDKMTGNNRPAIEGSTPLRQATLSGKSSYDMDKASSPSSCAPEARYLSQLASPIPLNSNFDAFKVNDPRSRANHPPTSPQLSKHQESPHLSTYDQHPFKPNPPSPESLAKESPSKTTYRPTDNKYSAKHRTKSTKPSSILKTHSSQTTRGEDSVPSADADEERMFVRTPRVRTSSLAPTQAKSSSLTSDDPLAANIKRQTGIPSPSSRTSSSHAGNSPSQHYSMSLRSPKPYPSVPIRATTRSSEKQMVESAQKSSSQKSGRVLSSSIVTRLSSPRTPTAPSLSRESTPKPGYTARQATVNTTETDSSADERIANCATGYQLRPETRPSYHRSPSTESSVRLDHQYRSALKYQSPLTLVSSPSTVVSDSPIPSECSEYETDQPDRGSEDSHARRRNELADLVAGLGLKTYTVNSKESPMRSERTAEATIDYTAGAPVILALSGSYTDVGFEDDTEDHDIVDQESEDEIRPIIPHAPRRVSFNQLNQRTEAENSIRTDFLPKPTTSSETNRDSIAMLNPGRQREAFGIPPSSSDLCNANGGFSSAESSQSLKHTVSEYDRDGRTDDGPAFSLGAEKLFQNLGIGAAAKRASAGIEFQGRRNSVAKGRASWRESMAEAEKYIERASPRTTLSASSSTSSIYEDDIPDRPWQKRGKDFDRIQCKSTTASNYSWRKTVSQSAYASLLDRYGETEMRRQEVVWELCESEQSFLKALRTTLELFIYPLLGKNHTWISGLDSQITRLFDWLDDIFQLHNRLNSALQNCRSSQYPVVLQVAETLRSFVPKLEIYQPYIVRLDEVVERIEAMIVDSANELGEFFRIQSASEECNGMSFSSFLWLPLTRLGNYLKFFNRLWNLTSCSHVDYLSTFSLLHSSTLIIRVMREVKLREDEYTLVKDLMLRIRGFPDMIQLLNRERRLIAHGALRRVHLSDQCKRQLEGQDASVYPAAQCQSRFDLMRSTGRSAMRRRRANSLDSCLSDAPSSSSIASAASSTLLARSEIDTRPGHAKSDRTQGSHDVSKTTPVYAYIFTDLAVFTVPSNVRSRELDGKEWEFLPDTGVCRILSLRDYSGKLDLDHMVGLQVLPMNVEDLHSGIAFDTTPTPLFLHLPRSQDTAFSVSRKRWWDALNRCYTFTLRSLSFPTYSGRYLAPGSANEPEAELRQSTVMSILASGLPLPKSPSVQLEEIEIDRRQDATLREREERGWWALRFKQTLRELQQESLPPTDLHKMQNLSAPSSRKLLSGKRRLKLGGDKRYQSLN